MNALAGTPLTVVIRQVSANVTVWHVVAQFRAASIGVDVYTWAFKRKIFRNGSFFTLWCLEPWLSAVGGATFGTGGVWGWTYLTIFENCHCCLAAPWADQEDSLDQQNPLTYWNLTKKHCKYLSSVSQAD